MDDFLVKTAPRKKGKHKVVEGTGIKEDVGVSSSKKDDCKEGVASWSNKDVVIKQEQSPTVLLCDCDCLLNVDTCRRRVSNHSSCCRYKDCTDMAGSSHEDKDGSSAEEKSQSKLKPSWKRQFRQTALT